MKTRVYKRMDKGDLDERGSWGVCDCMGEVQDDSYDTVLGIGGVGKQAKSAGIAAQINWIKIGPHKHNGPGRRGSLVTFDQFELFDGCPPRRSGHCCAGYSVEKQGRATSKIHRGAASRK